MYKVLIDAHDCPAPLILLGTVELKNQISKEFGIDLPATVTFDYPSIEALANFIANHKMAVKPVAITEPVQDAVLFSILETAATFVGRAVPADQPLMEAGLDSIGVLLRFNNTCITSFSNFFFNLQIITNGLYSQVL